MDLSHTGKHDGGLTEESESVDDERFSAASSELSEKSVRTQQQDKLKADKENAIHVACDSSNVDALISYATTEGGLLKDELRQKAWPLFLQCDGAAQYDSLKPPNDLPKHTEEEQVQLDVNRSFVYYPHVPGNELAKKKEQLSDMITQVLRNYPMLCYFQGYHDIVQVLLLVLGDQKAAWAMAQLIPAIIETTDPTLRRHLSNIQPFFALAATLTLYAHDIQEYSDIARLFDYLLAREPVVTIYLFVAFILSRKKELLEIPVDEPEMLHFTLSKLPQPLDLDGHILKAEQLYKDHPPETLPFGVWRHIPRCSVLKTSRDLSHNCSVGDAVKLFQQQKRQLRNEERRKYAMEFAWKHRWTAGSMALAILVGVASFYVRRKGLDTSIWSYIRRLRATWRG